MEWEHLFSIELNVEIVVRATAASDQEVVELPRVLKVKTI